MKKLILLFAIVMMGLSYHEVKAQSLVSEISWTTMGTNYKGLLVLYPNNQGTLIVKFYTHFITEFVVQDAVLNNQYDIFGNCTSYINCYNPRLSVNFPDMIYYADNFIVYPDGRMYTSDAAGNWSTMIRADMIPPVSWPSKFLEYNYRP